MMAHPNTILGKVIQYHKKHPELNIYTDHTIPGFFERRTDYPSFFKRSKTIDAALKDLQAKHLALETEREKVVELLHNLFPEPIIEKLQQGQELIAARQAEISVLFADIINFLDISDRLGPEEVIAWLNELFDMMDTLSERHKLDKIKTVGGTFYKNGDLSSVIM
jgi:hypothetical protein